MTRPLKITKDVHFRSMKRGRKVIQEGVKADLPTLGRVPRVSRVMALAIHMADLRHQGEVADYAELARLALVSRARMTQIMSLVLLAPDIQEEILYLPRVEGGRASVAEKMVRPIAAVPDWRLQRERWRDVKAMIRPDGGDATNRGEPATPR